MSYADLLINTCTTRRFSEGAFDDYGVRVKTWADGLTNQRCRLAPSSGVGFGGREIKVGAEVVIADYKLFIEDVDITEQDRVIISGITYEVLLVEDFADSTATHHKRCWLKVVR